MSSIDQAWVLDHLPLSAVQLQKLKNELRRTEKRQDGQNGEENSPKICLEDEEPRDSKQAILVDAAAAQSNG